MPSVAHSRCRFIQYLLACPQPYAAATLQNDSITHPHALPATSGPSAPKAAGATPSFGFQMSFDILLKPLSCTTAPAVRLSPLPRRIAGYPACDGGS